jgi:MFS family permease
MTPATPCAASGSGTRICTLAAAFLSGVGVMSLEIAGFRLVEPEFGSDIVVWGSLISVFLGGLALGAWAGGRLSDIRPALWKLGVVLGAAGLVALLLPLYSGAVLRWTFPAHWMPTPAEWSAPGAGSDLRVYMPPDLRWSALAAGALLFGLPAVVLGMVTPYAVKLRVRAMPNLGAGVGIVSGVSTLGGIAGTLGTAFYLIGWLGTRWLFVSNGVMLLVSGLALVLMDRLAPRMAEE